MRILFQTPHFGESEHDYRWGLVNSSGTMLSSWSSPEAALIEAAAVAGIHIATVKLVRVGPGAFDVRPR